MDQVFPVIDHALTGTRDDNDAQALQSVAARAGIDVPTVIRELFDKPVVHDTIIDKQDIEREILAFLEP